MRRCSLLSDSSGMDFTEYRDCEDSSHAGSCFLSSAENAKRDAVAGLRLVASCLSLLGALSIICSSIAKRQVSSPKVHPIFVLSIADCLLAVLWVVGGAMWMVGPSHSRIMCFIISLSTVVLECVAINLTLAYAIFAHAHIRASRLSPVALFQPYHKSGANWHPAKVTAVYLLAWLLPVAIVLAPFLGLGAATDILKNATKYSCWCMPEFSNVLPMALPVDSATMEFNYNLKKLVLSYAVIVCIHYLTVFLLLLLIYHKTLNHIKALKRDHNKSRLSGYYGATDMIIMKGHSDAKQRVLLYLLVFLISGFCNFVLAFIIIVHLSEEIHSYTPYLDLPLNTRISGTTFNNTLLAVFLIQSITVPLQGFLNAIVYGWTRGDFLYIMAASSSHIYHTYADGEPSDYCSNEEHGNTALSRDKMDTPEVLSGTYS